MKATSEQPNIAWNLVPLAVPNGRLQTGKQTLKPTELRTKRRIFLLSEPLRCTLVKQDQYWIASNEELAIEVPAKTRMEAEQTFAEAFEELYEFFVEMPQHIVTEGFQAKKVVFQNLVQAVYQR